MKKIFDLIKRNIFFIITLIVIFLLFNIKLPYYIETSGGLININDRYIIDKSYNSKGSINMTYVSEYKGTIPTLLIAKLNKNMDIIKKEEVVYENETEEEVNFRGKMMLKEASDNAIIISYLKADKLVKIKSLDMYITYIYNDSDTDLKIKDKIISIDNTIVNSKEEIKELIKNKNKIKIKVINDNKEYERYATIKDGKIGVIVTYDRDIETYPKIKVVDKKNEYGSSGGLMTTLLIYNKLTKFDITKGLKIAGTGTIEIDGTVGEIDGIKYKLKGAVKEKADVFLVPSGNYKEALKYKKQNKYNIKIVEVKTFDDAVNYLKNM